MRAINNIPQIVRLKTLLQIEIIMFICSHHAIDFHHKQNTNESYQTKCRIIRYLGSSFGKE